MSSRSALPTDKFTLNVLCMQQRPQGAALMMIEPPELR